ncbi:hypothetical protein MED222_05735 [Vibrio sp. MED222]|nr:hypothetical protein MED222_05735 [Vibrio sp. MED222]
MLNLSFAASRSSISSSNKSIT